jgi:hypothetical protein
MDRREAIALQIFDGVYDKIVEGAHIKEHDTDVGIYLVLTTLNLCMAETSSAAEKSCTDRSQYSDVMAIANRQFNEVASRKLMALFQNRVMSPSVN